MPESHCVGLLRWRIKKALVGGDVFNFDIFDLLAVADLHLLVGHIKVFDFIVFVDKTFHMQ
ncbi:MAG: hypothetical protein C3F12_00400 [Candidatus Methylomirabilota bacterium]|nr:hypothetical protein [candidate division NC10 bacterium]PWB48994.1 MAG: hypothetical protein C3F12_00400 [candidate division NC10 bacterium]